MALAIQKSRIPSVKGRLLSTLIMAFALMLQPMYGVVAGQVASAVAPAPAPEIHSVRFSTISSTYNGIVIDQYLKGFTDATEYRAIIHRADGTDAVRVGAVDTINHINSGGNMALTVPFNFAGSSAGSWYGAQNSSWTSASRPTGVTIEVLTTTHGPVTFSTPVSQTLVEDNGAYQDLIPAPVQPVITSVTPAQGSFIKGSAQRIDVNVENIDDVRTGNLQLNKVVAEGQSPANATRKVYTLQKDATGWYAMVDTTNLSGDGKYLFKVEAHGFDGVPHGYYGNNSAWQYPSYYFVVDNTAPKINSGSVEFNKMVNIGGVDHTSAKLGDGFLEVTFTTDEPLKLAGSQIGLAIPGMAGPPSTGWTKVELVSADENKYRARISLVDRTDTNIPGYEGFFNDKTFKDVKLYFRTVDELNNTDSVYYYTDGSFGRSPSLAYTFTLDNVAPVASIDIQSPTGAGDIHRSTVRVTGSVDPSEPNIKSHWFEIINPDGSRSYSYNMNTASLAYGFDLDTSKGDGEYRIRYVATDALGNRSDVNGSTIRTITVDNTPPALSVLSLMHGDEYLTTEDINIETNASDVIEIDRVVMFVNGRHFGEYDSRQVVRDFDTIHGGSSFFTIPAGVLPVGEHRLIVNAYDKAGNLETVRVSFSVIESEEDQEPANRPSQSEVDTPPSTTGGSRSDEEDEDDSLTNPGIPGGDTIGLLTPAASDTDPVEDSEVEGVVAGEQDETGTPLTDTATFGMDAPKLLGLVWYWWIAIVAALVGGWLAVAAAIRRSREEEA